MKIHLHAVTNGMGLGGFPADAQFALDDCRDQA